MGNKLQDILSEEGLGFPKKAGNWLDLEMYDDDERNLQDLVRALQGEWARVLVSLGGPTTVEIKTRMSDYDIEADPKAQKAIKHMGRAFGARQRGRSGDGLVSFTFFER